MEFLLYATVQLFLTYIGILQEIHNFNDFMTEQNLKNLFSYYFLTYICKYHFIMTLYTQF